MDRLIVSVMVARCAFCSCDNCSTTLCRKATSFAADAECNFISRTFVSV